MATKNIKRKIRTGILETKRSKDTDASSSEVSSSETEATTGNAAWADSIAKVLNTNKPKAEKSIVLSKAKKIVPKSKDASDAISFEIDGEIKEEKPDKDTLDNQVKKIRNQKLALRVKPTIQDFERERTLRKIATRGVVQLFNTVRMHQKEIGEQLKDAGPLDSKREAVLNNIDKKKFLDVLMSGKRAKSQLVDNPVKYETNQESENDSDEKKKGWSVLRPDYMTNKKIKHWDQEESDGAEISSDEEDKDEE